MPNPPPAAPTREADDAAAADVDDAADAADAAAKDIANADDLPKDENEWRRATTANPTGRTSRYCRNHSSGGRGRKRRRCNRELVSQLVDHANNRLKGTPPAIAKTASADNPDDAHFFSYLNSIYIAFQRKSSTSADASKKALKTAKQEHHNQTIYRVSQKNFYGTIDKPRRII